MFGKDQELVWAWLRRGLGGRDWWHVERSGWGTWGGQGAGVPPGAQTFLLLLLSGGQLVSFGLLLLPWIKKTMSKPQLMPKRTASKMLVLMSKRQRRVPLSQRMKAKSSWKDATSAVKRSNDESKFELNEIFSKNFIGMIFAQIKSFTIWNLSWQTCVTIYRVFENSSQWGPDDIFRVKLSGWHFFESSCPHDVLHILCPAGSLGSFPATLNSLKKCGS